MLGGEYILFLSLVADEMKGWHLLDQAGLSELEDQMVLGECILRKDMIT